ncbi:DUF4392 domain-containing protein [Thermanaerovibrio acidaminovorans]|jgi:hypothetical protein|uniref:DUF4392 domain-containing protein n=2 Tax=Thermanaerovibrio acidaminovorans TaxID=81462 RepID=UPI002FDA1AFC
MMDPMDLRKLGDLLASDRAGRMAPRFFDPSSLHGAALALREARRVVLVTGFMIPSAMAPETDGPPGAVWLARALHEAGKEVKVITDRGCLDAVSAAGAAIRVPREAFSPGLVDPLEWDALVYVERIGRSQDGTYRNMRGLDVSHWVEPLDQMALDALSAPQGPTVIAVGDGGNEAGMGNYRDALSPLVGDFARCLSVVESHLPLAVDVSNWGAYALAGLAFGPRWVPSPEAELDMLDAMLDLGAVDGARLRRTRSVDGFDPPVLGEVLIGLSRALDGSLG